MIANQQHKAASNNKTIVITGAARGIGYGLAEAFLERGCNVVICSRSLERVDQAVDVLADKYAPDRVGGIVCDVADNTQVVALWEYAADRYGRVDIWINNAAISAPNMPVGEQSPEVIRQVVDANILGTIYGCRVAIEQMIVQGGGHIYNVEGMGSDGSRREGATLYGMSKYTVRYLTKALHKENADTPVKVSAFQPGMVYTHLFKTGVKGGSGEQAKWILGILGDRIETVAPWLADRILANEKSGALISWLTTPKILWRFLTAPFRKRDVL